MDVRRILASLDNSYDSDLKVMFEAILLAKLPPYDISFGERIQFNKLKETIERYKDQE